jgi:hypothetical protein
VLAAAAGLTVLAGAAPATPARAESLVMLATRWPDVPGHDVSLEEQITEHLTQLGNAIGKHLDLLSHDMVQLTVDCRHRRAHLTLGGGDVAQLVVRIDSDIQFDDATARIRSRVDLAVHGHAVHFELPAFELSPAAYRGDYGLEFRLPLFAKQF